MHELRREYDLIGKRRTNSYSFSHNAIILIFIFLINMHFIEIYNFHYKYHQVLDICSEYRMLLISTIQANIIN